MNRLNNTMMKESIFIVGKVSLIEGRRVKVRVNKDKNLSHISYMGQTVKNVSVGSYVKICKGFIEIIGKVEGEEISEEKSWGKEYQRNQFKNVRFLNITLFGHFDGRNFKQGIKEMPLLDNECYLLDKKEFSRLHKFYSDKEKTIRIGKLTEHPSQEIELSIKKLFASHIGIFGNTGSGKSNTLATIFSELFSKFNQKEKFIANSRFLFIDFNGEYAKNNVFGKKKRIYNLTTRNNPSQRYPIKKDSIEQIEIISVLLEATEKTQKPFINRAINNSWLDGKDYKLRTVENIRKLIIEILQKGDQSLSISIFGDLFGNLFQLDISEEWHAKKMLKKIENGELKYHSKQQTYYITTKDNKDVYADSKINELYDLLFKEHVENIQISSDYFSKTIYKILSTYYHEIVSGYSNQEHIRPLIGRVFKKFRELSKVIEITDEDLCCGEYLEILNLEDVNIEMKKKIPLIVCKQLYQQHKREERYNQKSLHIIIDEAHNILSYSSERESETWKDYRLETFEELIKEGRKFSTFLTIASQRPYDISPTIISQLHNYFIHRLINDQDIKAVERTVAYMDKLSFESIPVLPVGSCFLAGLSSDVPVKVDIDLQPTNQQPKSETIDLQEAWFGN